MYENAAHSVRPGGASGRKRLSGWLERTILPATVCSTDETPGFEDPGLVILVFPLLTAADTPNVLFISIDDPQ